MVKLLYQNEFGPGHMISDESESLKRLTEEWESLPRLSSSSLTEPIGNHLVRVHLAALNREELPLLNAMFCRTASQTQGNREQFMKRLNCLSLYFSHADGFLADYKKRGCPPVGHSNHYRKAYQPAYRVISESYASFLQLIRTFAALLQERGTLTVAIDGNCASGKTTLSRLLSMRFDCNIIPMDDFFCLPVCVQPNVWQSRAGMSITSGLKTKSCSLCRTAPPYHIFLFAAAGWIMAAGSPCRSNRLRLSKVLIVCARNSAGFMTIPSFYPAPMSSR